MSSPCAAGLNSFLPLQRAPPKPKGIEPPKCLAKAPIFLAVAPRRPSYLPWGICHVPAQSAKSLACGRMRPRVCRVCYVWGGAGDLLGFEGKERWEACGGGTPKGPILWFMVRVAQKGTGGGGGVTYFRGLGLQGGSRRLNMWYAMGRSWSMGPGPFCERWTGYVLSSISTGLSKFP